VRRRRQYARAQEGIHGRCAAQTPRPAGLPGCTLVHGSAVRSWEPVHRHRIHGNPRADPEQPSAPPWARPGSASRDTSVDAREHRREDEAGTRREQSASNQASPCIPGKLRHASVRLPGAWPRTGDTQAKEPIGAAIGSAGKRSGPCRAHRCAHRMQGKRAAAAGRTALAACSCGSMQLIVGRCHVATRRRPHDGARRTSCSARISASGARALFLPTPTARAACSPRSQFSSSNAPRMTSKGAFRRNQS